MVLTELVERAGVDPEVIDDVIWGCVAQVGDQAGNIGRFAVLAAGWPETPDPGSRSVRQRAVRDRAGQLECAGQSVSFGLEP